MAFAISHILVPVDFSPHSEVALRYATELASLLGASVEFFHVVEDPIVTGAWSAEIPVPNLMELRKTLIDDGERRLEQYRGSVAYGNVPIMTTVRVGPPSPTITEYARAAGIDLIVMGTHGRTGLAHLFLGSVAERVVRHAPCPVVTLRDVTSGDKKAAAAAAERASLASALGHLGASRE